MNKLLTLALILGAACSSSSDSAIPADAEKFAQAFCSKDAEVVAEMSAADLEKTRLALQGLPDCSGFKYLAQVKGENGLLGEIFILNITHNGVQSEVWWVFSFRDGKLVSID